MKMKYTFPTRHPQHKAHHGNDSTDDDNDTEGNDSDASESDHEDGVVHDM